MSTVTLDVLNDSAVVFLKEQWRIGDATLVEKRFGFTYTPPEITPHCCADCALQELKDHAREWIRAVYLRLDAR